MTFGFFTFVASHYAVLLFFALSAYAFGSRLTGRVVFLNRFEQWLFASVVGLGALGTLALLLGLAGLLHAPVLIFALLAMLASGYHDLRATAGAAAAAVRRATCRASWWVRALCAAVVLAGSRLLLLPLYPPTQWDSISYHLAVANIYAREHAVVFTPYLRSPVFPQLNEMLFALAVLLYDDITAQLIQMMFLLLIAGALLAWARRSGAAQGGLWGAAIWISSPLVMMLASTGYLELSLTCFLTLAAYAFAVWHESRQRAWLMVAAGLLAFAEGTKYLALFPILLVGLFLLIRAARERMSREQMLDMAAFAGILLALAGPWHARIAWHTGNPIWPYAAEILGSGPWPLEQIHALLKDQFNSGAGTGLKAVAMLPWNLTFNLEKLHAGELPFTPVILYLLPLCVIAAVWNERVRLLLTVVTLYAAFWFFTAQNARYIVHAIPLLCLACGLALGELVALAPRLRDSATITALVCVALALPGYRLARQVSPPGWIAMPAELPPVSEQQRTAYITARVPEYTAIHHLNKTHSGPYGLFSFPHSNLAAYVNGTFVGDWYGPANYHDYLAQMLNPAGLYKFLTSNDVDYVLISQVSGFGDVHSDETLALTFMNGHLKLIYAHESLIYMVSDSPVSIQDTPELLVNRKLEAKLVNGIPPGWTARDAPLLDTTGKQAWNSTTAVGASIGRWLEQTVPVEPGAIYIFRAVARPTYPKQFGKFEITWLDSSANPIQSFTRLITGPADWLARVTATTAPPGAASARLRASSTDPSPMWFDWFSFKKLSYE